MCPARFFNEYTAMYDDTFIYDLGFYFNGFMGKYKTSNIAVYPSDKPSFRKLCAELGIVEAGDTDADLFRRFIKKAKKMVKK